MQTEALPTVVPESAGQVAEIVVGNAIESANASACALLRSAPGELVGRDLAALAASHREDPEDASSDWTMRDRAARRGSPQSFSWRFAHADGSKVEMLVELLPIDVGRVLARMHSLDAFDRQRGTRVEGELRLQQILDNSLAAVFVKDLEGRFLFVNREFERIKGMPVGAIVGRLDREVFPVLSEERRRNDARVIAECRAIDFEELVDTVRGGRTFLSHKFPLLDAEGRPYAICGIATDITGRKRSEEALRAAALAVSSAEGDDVFRELVRYLAQILDVDVAVIAVFADETRANMHALAAILDGKQLRAFDYPLAGSPCAKVVGRDFRFVASGVRSEFPPGTLFDEKGIDSYAALPLNDSDGHPLGLISVMDRAPLADSALLEAMLKIFATRAVAEIERRRAVRALSDSEASYRAIFEASEDAIFVHDWDTGAILDVSPAAEKLYGYTSDELKSMSVADFSDVEQGFTQAEANRRLDRARAGESVRFEWRVRDRSGRAAWHEVRLKRATIAGKPRILAYTRDIGAAKAADEALRASEEQYRAIFEASLDGLALGDTRGTLVDVNPAFCRMLGVGREEVIGADGLRFIAPGRRSDCVSKFGSVLQGEPCRMETEAVRRDASMFEVEVLGVPMVYRDHPHVLVVVRDLTERRRADDERAKLEAQLRQAQKMEALGHLTGGVAHDFNNLLTSIMGYVTLASETASAESDKRLGNYLEQAFLSCGRARDLIQQMLTFSRNRRGEPRAIALAPLVRDSVKLLRATFPASVALVTTLDEAAPAVRLDPVQLDQVLMNLAINARDAVERGGRIDVRVRHVHEPEAVCASCRATFRGDFVELAVADTGQGISAAVRERMFEPFYTTKGVGRGSGMGLSTVHGIVHEHGGHLIVESAPGQGAAFRVMLPALPPGDIALTTHHPADRSAPESRLCGRVLVVEDEPSVAAFMHDLLALWGLDVTVVDSPAAALEMLDGSANFDVVVTDQTMPGMTGLELAKRLQRMRPALPVLLYTGYSEGLTPPLLEAAGVSALLGKPLDPAAAFAALARALDAGEVAKKIPR